MGFSGFGRGRGPESAPPEAPMASLQPRAAAAPGGALGASAYIDAGAAFEGRLSFKDTVRIDGRLLGEVSCENTLVVGEGGELVAKVQAGVVVVAGQITGDVVAARRLHIEKSGRVEGDVQTPALLMEEGAVLNGRVRMGKSAEKPASKRPEHARPATPPADAE